VRTSGHRTSGASAREAAASRSRGDRAHPGQRTRAVGSVWITHPDRIVYPDANVTKMMVAEYYAGVGKRALAFVAGRPLAIVRCPDGLAAQCFFQKHVGRYAIPGIDVVRIDESTGRNPYAVANRVEALVGLAQWNAIELHVWGATAPAIDRPDTLVLDLDPDPALPWGALVEAARETRALLEALDMVSFVKTTGGKGLHVVVPLERRSAWEEVKAFAQAVAVHLTRRFPDRFTATMGEGNRRGRIFVDYLRNARGATAVAPYSLRARPGATVATPLAWDELSPSTPPSAFTIATVPERVARRKDPWADYVAARQRLSAKALRTLRDR
jgi:bifunctional non-homologous end joining protein LigD